MNMYLYKCNTCEFFTTTYVMLDECPVCRLLKENGLVNDHVPKDTSHVLSTLVKSGLSKPSLLEKNADLVRFNFDVLFHLIHAVLSFVKKDRFDAHYFTDLVCQYNLVMIFDRRLGSIANLYEGVWTRAMLGQYKTMPFDIRWLEIDAHYVITGLMGLNPRIVNIVTEEMFD